MADLTDEIEILGAAAEMTRLHFEFERARACILRGARERVDRVALRLVPDEGLDEDARARKALPLAFKRVLAAKARLEAEAVVT